MDNLNLLGGKSVNCKNIRVILDEDPEVSGLHPLDNNRGKHDKDSIEFIGEPTDLFYLQTEILNWTTFNSLTGYESWH
jgi:hypothetical protein